MEVLDRQSNEHISLALDRTKYMTFRIGRQDYGVDIVRVQDITCQSTVGAPHLKDVVDLAGTMVPIVHVTTSTPDEEPGDLFRIVIVVRG
jgi:purine-binding chemotaxis protein CheW